MKTIITAHSGAENTVDNTLESVRALLNCGAEYLEVDVCLQGERLVLTHDDPKPGAQYDSLEACFNEVDHREGIGMNIDVKQPDLVRRVAELAENCGMLERILFSGDVLSAADFAYARERGLTVWYNHTQIAKGTDLLQGAADAGYSVLNAHYSLATDAMLARAPERLSLWTVNEQTWLEKLLRAGVRNITTRRPVLARKLRAEIQGNC